MLSTFLRAIVELYSVAENECRTAIIKYKYLYDKINEITVLN